MCSIKIRLSIGGVWALIQRRIAVADLVFGGATMNKVYPVVLFAFLLAALPVWAHHGPTNSPSLYHIDRLVILEGEIVGVLWRNPHVRMKMSTADENGRPVVWELETTVPSLLKRAGITSDIIRTLSIFRR